MPPSKMKILIVEDDKLLIDTLKTSFDAENFEVSIANDGEIGLEMFAKIQPDIILLDLLMPKLDGIGMLKKLRQLEENITNKVPVIVLSNSDNQDIIQKAIEVGATDYYMKSNLILAELVKKINWILNKE
ncbi:response regulator [Candidatus Dojkabacteria bacterium]|nr:response regulator [Candidatus Dojkabacteria bacterium]